MTRIVVLILLWCAGCGVADTPKPPESLTAMCEAICIRDTECLGPQPPDCVPECVSVLTYHRAVNCPVASDDLALCRPRAACGDAPDACTPHDLTLARCLAQ